MDEYDFNLDLETWGLTSKQKELKRFERFISPQDIAVSSALFGYEGDRYYFDEDIRRHFGLDKYDSDVIPYWKTETVEAMNAFRLKQGYARGAGECVSLSTLYAAAAFIICQVPLEDIYMVLTPLHSQNFIDIQDGVLTNNRRLVTKSMWFNGTAISAKAQRALRHEKVTMVAHSSGYTHCLYNDATIGEKTYRYFADRLDSYLSSPLDTQLFASFLRSRAGYQRFFQLCRDCHGQPQFLEAEKLFRYENGSNYRIADKTHEKLLAEVGEEDFSPYPIAGRVRCDEFEQFVKAEKIDIKTTAGRTALEKYFGPLIADSRQIVEQLADFLHTEAKLPAFEKNYIKTEPIRINTSDSREQIIEYLQSLRSRSVTADLAFYACRDMASCDWAPFVKAAVEQPGIYFDDRADVPAAGVPVA